MQQISVALKETQAVDFGPEIKKLISSSFEEDSTRYSLEIEALNRMREKAANAGPNREGADSLFIYYQQLSLIDARFPTLLQKFTWAEISQSNTAFEKAGVLYNLGAVLSKIAASSQSQETAKIAYNYFQVSAGIFKTLGSNFLNAPSPELSRENTSFLCELMLAQAQESFVTSTIEQGKSGLLVAKLAVYLGDSYESMYDLLKSTKPKIFPTYFPEIFHLKSQYFSALAYTHTHISLVAQRKYGDSVAAITIADEFIKAATISAKAFSEVYPVLNLFQDAKKKSLLETFKDVSIQILFEEDEEQIAMGAAKSFLQTIRLLSDTVSELKRVAIRDNDLIYLEIVPAIATFANPGKICAVKCMEYSEICANKDINSVLGPAPDIFDQLVSMNSHEHSSVYFGMKESILRKNRLNIENIDAELRVVLESIEYHVVITKYKKGIDSGVPSQVWESTQNLKSQESSEPIQGILSFITSQNTSCDLTLAACQTMIDTEQQSCERFRGVYVHEWTQQVSSRLTGLIRLDLEKCADATRAAGATDLNLISNYKRLKPKIARLSLDTIEMDFAVKTSPNLIDDNIPDIAAIEKIYLRLAQLKKDRAALLIEIKEMVDGDDITSILAKNPGFETRVFEGEIRKYEMKVKGVEVNIMKSQADIESLTNVMSNIQLSSTFISLRQTEAKRLAVIDEYTRFFGDYIELRSKLEAAIEFYRELELALKNIERNVRKFCADREVEARGLKDKIDNSRSPEARYGSQISGNLSLNNIYHAGRATGFKPVIPGNSINSERFDGPDYLNQQAPMHNSTYSLPYSSQQYNPRPTQPLFQQTINENQYHLPEERAQQISQTYLPGSHGMQAANQNNHQPHVYNQYQSPIPGNYPSAIQVKSTQDNNRVLPSSLNAQHVLGVPIQFPHSNSHHLSISGHEPYQAPNARPKSNQHQGLLD